MSRFLWVSVPSVAVGRKSLKSQDIRPAQGTLISLEPQIFAVRYKAVKGFTAEDNNSRSSGGSQVSPPQVYLCIYMGAAFPHPPTATSVVYQVRK
jgi:hypothetical protein